MKRLAPLLALVASVAAVPGAATTLSPLLVVSTTRNAWSDDHIFVAAPGGKTRAVALGSSPGVSADGRWIAYVTPDGSAGSTVSVMRVDGSARREVAHFQGQPTTRQPVVWSADARRLAVPVFGDVELVEVATGATHRVAGVYGATFSPDSAHVAYAGQYGLTVADADGSAAHVVAPSLASAYGLAWSPDGDWIALGGSVDNRSMVLAFVHPDGTGIQTVSMAGGVAGTPAWSSDGRVSWIGNNRLWVASPTTAARTLGPAKLNGWPQPTPVWVDGDRQIVTNAAGGAFAVTDAATGRAVRSIHVVAPAQMVTSTAAFARTKLVYAAHDRDRDLELALVRGDGTGFRLLTDNGVDDKYPSWSPDGRTIVFVRKGRDGGIFTLHADGTGLRRLTHDADFTPVFSPDGRSIAFARGHAILLMAASGGKARLIAETTFPTRQLAWEPDGTKLVLSDNYVLTRLDVASGKKAPIPLPSAPGDSAQRPVVSPDGRRVAFRGYIDGHSFRDPEAYGLYVANIDGTGLRKVRSGIVVAPVSWSRDGRTVAVTDGGRLWTVDVDGTADTTVVGARGPLGSGLTGWASFRPR